MENYGKRVNYKKRILIRRANPKIARAIRKISKAKDISQNALVQMFIKEGLKRLQNDF